MSVTANDKGAVEQRVNLIKRGEGDIQHVMLNSILIKKSENYALMTDRFVTNMAPFIMQHPRTIMKFRPKRDAYDVNFNPNDVNEYDIANPDELVLSRVSDFTSKVYSVARLCEALAVFVKDFNFALHIQGAHYTFIDRRIPRHAIALAHDANPNGFHPYDLGNYVAPGDVGYRVPPVNDLNPYVALGFSHEGCIQLTMSHHFLTNFYIELDPVFAKQVGFPQYIYANEVGNVVTISNQPGIPDLLLPPVFVGGVWEQHFVNDSAIPMAANGQPRVIQSTKSVFNCDDRLSVDIEISLPLSQSIDVFNGSETHTYLLNRFMITDYVTVQGRTQQKGGVILTKSIINDKLSVGFTDLVYNQPTSHTAQLLNGKIQEMDVRLVLRYKKYTIEVTNAGLITLPNDQLKFTIARKTIELEHDGLYDLLLAFNKLV